MASCTCGHGPGVHVDFDDNGKLQCGTRNCACQNYTPVGKQVATIEKSVKLTNQERALILLMCKRELISSQVDVSLVLNLMEKVK